jgi:hypothetical protein
VLERLEYPGKLSVLVSEKSSLDDCVPVRSAVVGERMSVASALDSDGDSDCSVVDPVSETYESVVASVPVLDASVTASDCDID